MRIVVSKPICREKAYDHFHLGGCRGEDRHHEGGNSAVWNSRARFEVRLGSFGTIK